MKGDNKNDHQQESSYLKTVLGNEVVLLCVFVILIAGVLWFSSNYFVVTKKDAPQIFKFSMITVFLLAFIAHLDNNECK